MVSFLQDFWWFLVLIGVMILLHELGHYLVGRFFDVKIDAFSIGFGPRLFGFRRGETDFKVCLILFGGYVKFAGEQPGDEQASDPRALPSKPRSGPSSFADSWPKGRPARMGVRPSRAKPPSPLWPRISLSTASPPTRAVSGGATG